MNPEIASIALQFIARVDLKGNEAPAMMRVIMALEQIANPPKNVAQNFEQVKE